MTFTQGRFEFFVPVRSPRESEMRGREERLSVASRFVQSSHIVSGSGAEVQSAFF